MSKFIALLVVLLLPLYIADNKQISIVVMPSIKPTTLAEWVDTCAARYNIPSKIIYYVGTMESGWGKSKLAKRNNNLFGIKQGGKWAKYGSKFESIEDFCKFINKHYPNQVGKTKGVFTLWGYRGKGKHWRVKL